ncbi:hypothetical protein NDU88_000636 [Pleurodeles waltl]|uniref:Uncharacterized protein n=1 Tax=Pleurodeles waltl TaxID=8319 RepID=A0AAV7P4G3_PLEWA|nr:hypothetical protein NDU88_000636 [Pleurodeles waltl]
MGLAPAGVAASMEQRLGPSGMRSGLSTWLADVDLGEVADFEAGNEEIVKNVFVDRTIHGVVVAIVSGTVVNDNGEDVLVIIADIVVDSTTHDGVYDDDCLSKI